MRGRCCAVSLENGACFTYALVADAGEFVSYGVVDLTPCGVYEDQGKADQGQLVGPTVEEVFHATVPLPSAWDYGLLAGFV